MKTDVKKALTEGHSLHFVHAGKACGVSVERSRYAVLYHAWCGRDRRDYGDASDAVTDRIYDGESLQELAEHIVIYVSH